MSDSQSPTQLHDISIESSFTEGVWHAACSCGWTSEQWEDPDDALLDGDDHRMTWVVEQGKEALCTGIHVCNGLHPTGELQE